MVRTFLLAAFAAILVTDASASEDLWVTVDRLNRRTCPSTACGVVGQLFYRAKATIFERQGEWGRITKYYDAACSGGRSAYVDEGNAACAAENGIQDGKFAEWISMKFLASTRPPDPGENATGTAALVRGSDDFRIYETEFVDAAEKLLSSGQCAASDFVENGGWWKSSSYGSRPVYFTYCGGNQTSDRIYLDASNGKIFR